MFFCDDSKYVIRSAQNHFYFSTKASERQTWSIFRTGSIHWVRFAHKHSITQNKPPQVADHTAKSPLAPCTTPQQRRVQHSPVAQPSQHTSQNFVKGIPRPPGTHWSQVEWVNHWRGNPKYLTSELQCGKHQGFERVGGNRQYNKPML